MKKASWYPDFHLFVEGDFGEEQEILPMICEGELFWDEAAEGHFCTECWYYDGIK